MSFTRNELQALRERAKDLSASAGKGLAGAYLELAEAADALDAKLARDALDVAPAAEDHGDPIQWDPQTFAGALFGAAEPQSEPAAPLDPPGVHVLPRVRSAILDLVTRRTGASRSAARAAFAFATQDRPLIDWLKSGGLKELIALVVQLLPLFL